jgi:3-oxoacyl-[acyl-carrier-protein] synthase-3
VSAAIAGIGVFLPPEIRTNAHWPETFGASSRVSGNRIFNDIGRSEDPESARLVQRDLEREATDPFLGAVQRRVADPELTACEAEANAATAALADAGIEAADVDVLLSNAVVPERMGPCAPAVAHRLGAKRAVALDIEAACASAIAQLELGRAYIESRMAEVVVLTQSHLLLRAFPSSHPASPGIGDAASALVLVRSERGLVLRSTFGVTHGDHARAVLWTRGVTRQSDVPWWKAGGEYQIGTHAPKRTQFLMRETVGFGKKTIQSAAERAHVDVERIAVLASVQPRGFLPGAIAERLGLSRAHAVTTYEELAHVGVCGPVCNLARARQLGRLSPGALIALYGQGAGFTRYAAIAEMV